MLVTITDTRYDHTTENEIKTPLGGNAQTVLLDNIVVTFSVGEVKDHELHFSPEAIADRKFGYGLKTEKEAVEALVREVVFGWASNLQAADPNDKVQAFGGVDERISIEWNAAAQSSIKKILKAHKQRIARVQTFIENAASKATLDFMTEAEPVPDTDLPEIEEE